MKTPKFSKNHKLNAVLTAIYNSLCDRLGESEIKRYKEEYPREKDFNIVEYGNLLISHYDIRQLYRECGYRSLERYSDTKIWDTYKKQVGYIARHYFPTSTKRV